MVEPVSFGLGLLGLGVIWMVKKCCGCDEQPKTPQPEKAAPPAPAAPSTPTPSLITRACNEVKQVVAVGHEKLEQGVEKVIEIFAEATECISDDFRRIRGAATAHWTGLVLPWSGVTLQLCDVQMLRKSLLKTPPPARAPTSAA
jgi:hypothetical protein